MSDGPSRRKCIAAVRVRGTLSAFREARETLQMLHLTRNNYAVLVNDNPSFIGMLKAAQGFVTWGEPTKDVVTLMLKEKGKFVGNKKLEDEKLSKLGYKSVEELSDAVFNCKVDYWKLPGIQPLFRLHPPTKGFRGKIKKSFIAGGELGYRGEKISELLRRMT
jgi:large subunit ribosomal protein L30